MQAEHQLLEVAEFRLRTVTFQDGLPIMEPVTPYWRWYCSCGVVSGKIADADAARADHARHVDSE